MDMVSQMLFPNAAAAEPAWEPARWRNFSAAEIACQKGACPHCGGEVFLDEVALDCLQRLRDELGSAVVINSGHRCQKHNAEIGGASHSAHLALAFDIAVGEYDRKKLFKYAQSAGFSHFGFMVNALHLDTRARGMAATYWTYGPRSIAAWEGIVPEGASDIGGS